MCDKMYFLFDAKIISGKIYKWLFQYLCEISGEIYFTYNEVLMINNKLFELCETCEQIEVSKRIKNGWGNNIMGFKVDLYIKKFIYNHENAWHLLGDRGYGCIIFYHEKKEIAYIEMDDFKDICIKTNEKKIINRLSEMENNGA